ncbi:hypothetical protein CHISP_3610 [Chitinispirillum alkaliphilum]|nr:hypothetical protein CHISP_3610 [Chitinispirillum alkaliphilum]
MTAAIVILSILALIGIVWGAFVIEDKWEDVYGLSKLFIGFLPVIPVLIGLIVINEIGFM